MKRILKSIAVLAVSALAMVSCQKELLGPAVQEGQEVEVSIDLTTPLMGTKANAFGDGNTVNKVRVHVYQKDASGNLTYIEPAAADATTKTPSQTVDMTGGRTATYKTRLVTGQTYTFVFWAEKDGNGAYTYDTDAKTITVNYSGAAGNDEKRDAFYNVLKDVTITGAYSASVQLHRPFAQLNFGASDYDAAKAAGITVTGAAVKVTGVANTLNLLDGSVSGSETVTFASAELPTDLNATLSAANKTYKYVAMDYVLVGKDAKTLSDVTLTLDVTETTSTTPKYTYTSVPLQGNFRTNIVGNLFTSPADIQIEVVPGFNNPDENVVVENVSNITAANTAFASGATSVNVTEISSSDPEDIILPATTSEVSLTLPAAPDGKTITIKYRDGASVVPAALNITAVNAESLTIVAPKTHVELNGITVTNLTASTSNTTLVVGADVTVGTLTIKEGAVEIYGNVGTLTKGANAGDVKVWAVGDIETWKKAYTAGAQRIELTANISSAEETNLYVPIQGTVDGNGKEISGSISLNVNALGGTIQNLNFKNIHKSDNKLSAIYASGLSGKLVITGCSFDTFDWDAIQTTPVAGAEIEIVDNTFRYSEEPGTNNRRYIHIESGYNVDFAAKVSGNSFYDNAKLRMSAIEVYFFTDNNKIDISSNYIDAPAKVCILRNNLNTVATEILKAMTVKTAPDGEEVNLAGYINISGDQRIFTSLSDAFAAVAAGQTIVMLRDITSNSGFLFDKEVSASFDLGGNTLKVTEASNANGRAIRIDKGTLTVKNGTIDARNVDSEGNPADETSNESGGMFGAIRVNETAQAVLENLTMYNNHFYGLCIKPASGTTVTMSNCTINSYIGGCIEVAGANTTISNCTFNQSGQSSKSWISTAIAVSYGGVANVTDTQITADAEIPLYIYNSGGTLNINGGTYVGNSGKVLQVDAQASNQSYSTASITGGTFTGAFGKTNTGKEIITVTGGSYSFNPTDYVPSEYTVSEVDGKYVVSAQ